MPTCPTESPKHVDSILASATTWVQAAQLLLLLCRKTCPLLLTPGFWGSVHVVFGADLNLYQLPHPAVLCISWHTKTPPEAAVSPTMLQCQAALAYLRMSLLACRCTLQVYTACFHVPGPQLCAGSGISCLCSTILKQTSLHFPLPQLWTNNDAPVGPWTCVNPSSC